MGITKGRIRGGMGFTRWRIREAWTSQGEDKRVGITKGRIRGMGIIRGG